jgi:uncharacterized phiE125 gp8 family phage protein
MVHLLDLSLITAPATEPVTLTEAKLHCRVDSSAEDALLTALIVAARQHVEETTGRALITQTREIRLDAWPRVLYLPRPPVSSITSVTYTDDTGATATLSASAYALRTGTEPGCVLFDGTLVPSVTLADMAGVNVRYECGYGGASSVPKPVFQALLLLIGHWYANREAVAAGNLGPLPMAVDALLAPYRVHWFGEWAQ